MQDTKPIPTTYAAFNTFWQADARRQASPDAYTGGKHSFIPNLLPEVSLSLSAGQTLNLLRERFDGNSVNAAFPSETGLFFNKEQP